MELYKAGYERKDNDNKRGCSAPAMCLGGVASFVRRKGWKDYLSFFPKIEK